MPSGAARGPAPSPAPSPRRRPWWPFAVVGLVLAGSLAWYLLSDDDSTSPISEAAPDDSTSVGPPDAGPVLVVHQAPRAVAPRKPQPAVDGGEVPPSKARAEVSAWLRRNAEEAARAVEPFCTASQRFKDSPVFHAPSGKGDAATYLANRVDWDIRADRPPGSDHLSAGLVQHLHDYGPDWSSKVTSGDLAGLDFGWMKKLQDYDAWSYPPSGVDPATQTSFIDPMPNYNQLLDWAKLRMAAGIQSGDVAAASADVRHLADLMASQNSEISTMVGLSVLRNESDARAAIAAKGGDVSAWPPSPVNDDLVEKYRNVERPSYLFFAPGVSPEVMRRAAECLVHPCSTLTDAVSMQAETSSFAPESNREDVLQLARQYGCSGPRLDRVQAYRALSPQEAMGQLSVAKSLGELFPP